MNIYVNNSKNKKLKFVIQGINTLHSDSKVEKSHGKIDEKFDIYEQNPNFFSLKMYISRGT